MRPENTMNLSKYIDLWDWWLKLKMRLISWQLTTKTRESVVLWYHFVNLILIYFLKNQWWFLENQNLQIAKNILLQMKIYFAFSILKIGAIKLILNFHLETYLKRYGLLYNLPIFHYLDYKGKLEVLFLKGR